jgi:hypothetical protein
MSARTQRSTGPSRWTAQLRSDPPATAWSALASAAVSHGASSPAAIASSSSDSYPARTRRECSSASR